MEFTERPVLILIRSKPFGTIFNFEGWRASVGMFGMDHEPVMLFMGDGVYSVLKNMHDQHIRMFKSTYKSFDGRFFVSKKSLDERGISSGEIMDDAEIVGDEEIGDLFMESEITITF